MLLPGSGVASAERFIGGRAWEGVSASQQTLGRERRRAGTGFIPALCMLQQPQPETNPQEEGTRWLSPRV